MGSRFVFFYLMKPLPGIREVVPLHVEYWKTLHLEQYAGGPFADRTGGLISFEAPDLDRATALASADPFVTHDLIAARWIKEWLPE